MKITKRQLRQIIKEEKQRLHEEAATNAQLAEKAKDLGHYLGGYPQLAKDIAEVFKQHGRPESAQALMKAFEYAQQELDMIYSVLD